MLQQDGPFDVPTPPARRHLSQTQTDLQTPLDLLCLLYSSHSGPSPGNSAAQMHKRRRNLRRNETAKENVRRQNKARIFCLTRERFYALGSSSALHAANLQLAVLLDVWPVI